MLDTHRMVDFFGHNHPTVVAFTRCLSKFLSSATTMDPLLASWYLVRAEGFEFEDAGILSREVLTDHPPIVAYIQCPKVPSHGLDSKTT